LAALLEQTVGLLGRTLPETIRIVVEPVTEAFVVAADPHQLSQVLTNLAVNARDAMALGGELRFRLGREHRTEAHGDAAPGPDVASGHGETVLVVEDEPPVRQALAQALGELNYRVLVASSAEQALELHAAHADEVSLVLTDLVMPGMGGLRLVQELRE